MNQQQAEHTSTNSSLADSPTHHDAVSGADYGYF